MASSTTIEKEIVQLELDAKKFSSGIKKSTDELTGFKKSFDMKGAVDALSEIEKASYLDFSSMAQSLDSINNKMSLVGVAAGVMVAKVTESILSAGKKLLDNVILDPVTTGLEEYETQLNAVQTILANTQKQGTTLKDVNAALDELNTYADLTIYNFTQMTENIGKFTAAGVELDTSVSAIKGISNLAALSGSNAQQASTAMYQLSQAISTGSLKLQDWNSVVNAGMGGQVFQDALTETARVHGVAVDNMIKQDGSFRESLSRGWITSEILLETLNKLTGDLTDAQLEQMGYSDEQIGAIQKQAQTALDAATKIKTVTQLIDTMKEALQSGWSLTWRIIFGDFEEAKKLWGGVAEVLGGLIEENAAARNRLLNAWSNIGGRDIAIRAFFDLLRAGENIIRAFAEAVSDIFGTGFDASDLLRITKRFADFALKIRMGTNNLDNFKSIIRGVASLVDIFFRIVSAIIKPILLFGKGVELVDGGLWALLGALGDSIVAWREFAINTGLFDKIVQNVVRYLGLLIGEIRVLVKRFLELDIVQEVVEWFQGLNNDDFVRVWNGLKLVLQAIIAPFYFLAIYARQLYEEVNKLQLIEKVIGYWQSVNWGLIAEWWESLAESAEEMFNTFRQSDVVESFVNYINTFDGRRITQFMKDAEDGFSWLDTLIEFVGPKIEGLVDSLATLPGKARELAGEILDAIKDVFDYLASDADNLDYSTLFDIINTGILGGVFLALKKIASGDFISGIIDDSDFGEVFIDTFDRLEGTLGSFQNNIRADTLKKIATSIAILVGSIWLITLIDSEKLKVASAAIAIMIATLFGSSGALKVVSPQDAIKASIAIIGLAIALNFMGTAMRIISGLNPVEMGVSLTGLVTSITALVLAIKNLPVGGGTLKTVAVIAGIAVALLLFSAAIKTFGNIDPIVLGIGLASVGASLAMLTASLATLQASDKGGSSIKAALAMITLAKALENLGDVVQVFGQMKPSILLQGLITVGLLLASLAAFSTVIKTEKILQAGIAFLIISASLLVMAEAVERFGSIQPSKLIIGLVAMAAVLLLIALSAKLMTMALPGALATLVMAVAITVLAGALHLLAQLEWDQLGIALAAIAGAMLIFIVAGYLLAPVVLVLLAFGAALLLIGAGAALFGLGITLAATGLVALAGSAVLIGQAIRIVGAAFEETLPGLGVAFAETISGFFVTLAEKAPEMKEAFKTLILTAVQGLTEIGAEITIAIVDLVVFLIGELLNAIVDLYSDITDAGWDLLMEFLGGIADNIQEAVDTGLQIVEEFLEGVASGLPGVMKAAVELYFVFLETIESEVVTPENIQRYIDIGLSIAGNIVEGFVRGLANGVGKIVGKIGWLVAQAKSAFNSGLEVESPSKWMLRYAGQIVEGFVVGLVKGVDTLRSAVNTVTDATKEAFDPLLQALFEGVEQDMELTPVVTPVIDLSGITAADGLIRDAFANVIIPVSAEGVSSSRAADASTTDDGRGGVTYNQYNYSPKALSRADIYRQTNTQLARLSTRRIER